MHDGSVVMKVEQVKADDHRWMTLPSKKESVTPATVSGGPSLRGSTPNHWTSMAAGCPPKEDVLQGASQAQDGPQKYRAAQQGSTRSNVEAALCRSGS